MPDSGQIDFHQRRWSLNNEDNNSSDPTLLGNVLNNIV